MTDRLNETRKGNRTDSAVTLALRNYIATGGKGTKTRVIKKILDFAKLKNQEQEITQSYLEKITQMSRDFHYNRHQDLIIHDYFESIGFQLVKDEFQQNKKISKSVFPIQGRFYAIYDLGMGRAIDYRPYFDVRLFDFDIRDFEEESAGSFVSLISETRAIRSQEISGPINVERFREEPSLLMITCVEKNRARPYARFLVRFITVNEAPVFYGIAIGFRASDYSKIVATKVLGLPSTRVELGNIAVVDDETVPKQVFNLIESYFSNKIGIESTSYLIAGSYYSVNGRDVDISYLVEAIFQCYFATGEKKV